MHDPARYRPTERFGDRVADYALARPGYPAELTSWLLANSGLGPGAAVADIGAGTGLFTRDLLAAGLRVHAVEPNGPMRAEAERTFANHPGFISCEGTAEATGLQSASIDLLTAAQAFHWFDPLAAGAEARRILKPRCKAALIWNVRRLDSVFSQGYEDLLMKYCPAYAEGQPHQAAPEDIAAFFNSAVALSRARFDLVQVFDHDRLRARLLSSSYTPTESDPARLPLLAALHELFERHQLEGRVEFEYYTNVFLGRP